MIIKNSHGLSFEFLENGSVKCVDADGIRISLKPASLFSAPGTNLWLRLRKKPFVFTPLLGPESSSTYAINENVFLAAGKWEGLEYKCQLEMSDKSLAWRWNVELENNSGSVREADLIYVQDTGLKQVSTGLVNEYYVSQYLERRILDDNAFGKVICCRQNMREQSGNPWLMLACIDGAVSATVDGMQFYGKGYRATGIPEGLLTDTAGGEYAGESSVLVLRSKPFSLLSRGKYSCSFAAIYLPDHSAATSADDLKRLPYLVNEFRKTVPLVALKEMKLPVHSLFNMASFLPSEDLDDEELKRFFGTERRHAERDNGRLLAFFCGENNHVMLRPKELLADRPHGHIIQAGDGYSPDERIVSTTAFASGVFNSHLTQGNTNFNILLSVCTSQFNLSTETGQRIFVALDGTTWLLGVPSAFEMGLNHCRWIYKYRTHCFELRTWTSKATPQVNLDFSVISGEKVKLVVTHHFDATNGWQVMPGTRADEVIALPSPGSMLAEKFPSGRFRIRMQSAGLVYHTGTDEMIMSDKVSHDRSVFVIEIAETTRFCMSFLGEICHGEQLAEIYDADRQWLADGDDARSSWRRLSMNLSIKSNDSDVMAVSEILPWYGMNALTHYLTPYGLEQFGGAAWGTRDVAQGPFDLLLCMGRYEEAAQVLRIIFSNQNRDGGWPQWWMFDSYSDIRADSAHGDVIYWCLIALSNYIRVTGDQKILDEELPYYDRPGEHKAERETLDRHADRVINMITGSFIPGTALVPFGGGDWNDSLQPVSKELARKMISSWTVEMNYQAFSMYSDVCEYCGNMARARELRGLAERIRSDFNRYLVRDGCVAGYGLSENDNSISLLLHPSDSITGIGYSILPMERGIISGIFTPEQAGYHYGLIEEHLKGPDGARLMDRPLKYRGGVQTFFQRAESSTFFGREIGLMYIHEHIRYAESLALTGRAEAFMKALRQAIPVAYRDIVPCGDIRQSNCYYSSSDVVFRNRYEADELYNDVLKGKMTLRGGWRVYSSGPGIYIGIVITRLLGLRHEFGNIIIDPVMPRSLDCLSVAMILNGRNVTFKYVISHGSHSPKKVRINGSPVSFSYDSNKYRKGGAIMAGDLFYQMLDRQENIVEIEL